MALHTKKANIGRKYSSNSSFHRLLALLAVSAVSLMTRLYKLNEPEHVCWDETHFGKMASYYINRTFFFDVHPPLGKMLIGLSGALSGYDGRFTFENPGQEYNDANYMGMRAFCAILGSAVAPLSFLTVVELTQSIQAGIMAASLIIFDTGCLTLSQYILLDPILLFFIMTSTYCLVMFLHSQSSTPFKLAWWLWMAATGISLACAFSVKFVGLFVILLAGVMTMKDLWRLLGDLSLSKTTLFYHLLSRASCLIFLPMLIYLIGFAVHLKVLNQSGNGDAHFSSYFQSSLLGNSLYNASMPKDIAYGSIITLRNHRVGGGLLHSHPHLYPEELGPKQQQITTYSHKDENNQWLVKRSDVELNPARPVQFVTHGDFVRLEHIRTGRNLHSHAEPAPISRDHYQVSAYGINGTGDMNDIWRVEMVRQTVGSRVRTVFSQIKLIHYRTECVLYTSGKQLPKWGWEQQEVTCNPDPRDSNDLWNVEDHTNPRLPNISFEVLSPSFWEKFIESHVVMLKGNSQLKPKVGEVTSRPWQWPFNYRGQWFSGGHKSPLGIYLLGNPIVFIGNLACLVVFLLLYGLWLLSEKKGCTVTPALRVRCQKTFSICELFFLGWLLHYAPFYIMGRVLYFHHYFPAMLFNSMLSGVVLDFILQSVGAYFPSKTKLSVYNSSIVVVLSIVIHSFYLFHPLSYGITHSSGNATSNMDGLHWMDSWEF
ncbi:protein O-mannosyl-transferase 2-like isoform X1 [Asterias rubens]|uniref:protein O-mannosyl-transferase 2-like isoform X1 n=1 Tax=Asterias rubens TaxID=7604 RepID=UPI0014553DE8|nr:protein O-mannosyl-transferase 2-like isoform X1 [Asterias rubens]